MLQIVDDCSHMRDCYLKLRPALYVLCATGGCACSRGGHDRCEFGCHSDGQVENMSLSALFKQRVYQIRQRTCRRGGTRDANFAATAAAACAESRPAAAAAESPTGSALGCGGGGGALRLGACQSQQGSSAYHIGLQVLKDVLRVQVSPPGSSLGAWQASCAVAPVQCKAYPRCSPSLFRVRVRSSWIA